METIQKTTHQIIDEVVSKYTLSTRSMAQSRYRVDTEECSYVGKEGRTCAFGMMCNDPHLLIEDKNAKHQLEKFGDVILKPEYRGYDPEFYNDIQRLHDYAENWTEQGLSAKGALKVQVLKEKYQFI